jgi:hypothetical protein
MRQDPNAVPHPRSSAEQISYQPDEISYQPDQISQQQDQDEQPPAWPPKARPSLVRRSPAWQPPDRQPSYQPTSYRQAPPIYPAAQRPGLPGYAREDSGYGAYEGYGAYDAGSAGAKTAHVNGWQGSTSPRLGDQEIEATLARIRAAHRKTKRMQVVCVLLAACTAAIFLTAVVSHQLDGHIELLTPVLLLTSAANFRRYAQRATKYRAAEADILARAR